MPFLPTELIELILQQCVYSGDRAGCRDLRLTCRLFDRILKPYVCRTVNVNFRSINRNGIRKLPRWDALDTVGCAAKVINIDMSVVRDPCEQSNTPLALVSWLMHCTRGVRNVR